MTLSIDPAHFPIVATGPFGTLGEPPHVRLHAAERGVCEAIGSALGLSGVTVLTHHLDRRDEFRKASLNLLSFGSDKVWTECRLRIIGLVKRAGVEYLGASVIAYAGEELVSHSEDLSSTPSKCAILCFADAAGQPLAIDDAIRDAVARLNSAAPVKPKAAKEKTPPLPATPFVADSPIRSVDVSPDGKWIATTHESQYLTVWEAATGRRCWSKRAGGSGMQFVQSSAFSPDSRLVVTGSSSTKVFEVATGEAVAGPAGHPKGELVFVAWTQEGIATVSAKNVMGSDRSVALWEPSGKLRWQWKWDLPRRIAVVPGAVLVSGYKDDRKSELLCRIDPKTGKPLATLEVDSSWFAVTDGGVWVNAGGGGQLLDLKTLEPKKKISQADLVSAAGRSLYTISGANVRHHNDSGEVVASWEVPEVRELCIAPNGQVIVAAGLAVQVFKPDGSAVRLGNSF